MRGFKSFSLMGCLENGHYMECDQGIKIQIADLR